jgi:hypothetical protein
VQLSLTRLRLAFLALGALLSGALGLFVSSALERLARQRELRHRVVAERIFDELERELTAHLVLESERPSSAYDEDTSPEAWAPFVVGYFTVADGYRVVAREQLEAPRVARLERALSSVWPGPAGVPERAEPQPAPVADRPDKQRDLAAAPADKAVQSSPEVMRRLNRAKEEREQQQQRVKQKPRPSNPKELDDPFQY